MDAQPYNPWAAPVYPGQNDNAMQPETYANPLASHFFNGMVDSINRLMNSSTQRPDTSQENVRYATASPLVNITDEDINRGINVGMSAGPGMIKAYHGSPHNFDAFDLSKIGTGEGAQAYGHGLYFAEHEPVAQEYRDVLKWKGASFDDPQVMAQNSIDRLGDRESAAKSLESAMASTNAFHRGKPPASQIEANKTTQQAIDLLRSNEPITGKPPTPGHMYEVNINADPSHFLDWDKPLARDWLETHMAAFPDVLEADAKQRAFLGPDKGFSGRAAYAKANNWNPAQSLSPTDAAGATKALADAGIPGIKYLDQGSRGAGEGSSNYVVFNDKLIDILRKYAIPGMVGAPIFGNAMGEQKP